MTHSRLPQTNKLVEVLMKAFEQLNKDTPIHSGSFLHQDIMLALEDVGAIAKAKEELGE